MLASSSNNTYYCISCRKEDVKTILTFSQPNPSGVYISDAIFITYDDEKSQNVAFANVFTHSVECKKHAEIINKNRNLNRCLDLYDFLIKKIRLNKLS